MSSNRRVNGRAHSHGGIAPGGRRPRPEDTRRTCRKWRGWSLQKFKNAPSDSNAVLTIHSEWNRGDGLWQSLVVKDEDARPDAHAELDSRRIVELRQEADELGMESSRHRDFDNIGIRRALLDPVAQSKDCVSVSEYTKGHAGVSDLSRRGQRRR